MAEVQIWGTVIESRDLLEEQRKKGRKVVRIGVDEWNLSTCHKPPLIVSLALVSPSGRKEMMSTDHWGLEGFVVISLQSVLLYPPVGPGPSTTAKEGTCRGPCHGVRLVTAICCWTCCCPARQQCPGWNCPGGVDFRGVGFRGVDFQAALLYDSSSRGCFCRGTPKPLTDAKFGLFWPTTGNAGRTCACSRHGRFANWMIEVAPDFRLVRMSAPARR